MKNNNFFNAGESLLLSCVTAGLLAACGGNESSTQTSRAAGSPQMLPTVVVNEQTTIIAKHSNKCLNVRSDAALNGAVTEQLTCDGQPSQNWIFRDTGAGRYQIVSGNSGKCLDVPNGSTVDGAILQQWDCAVENKQLWTLQEEPDGYFRVISVASGKCLDVAGIQTDDGRAVQQWSCLDQDNQRWRMRTVADAPTVRYTGPVIAKHSNKCLNVKGGLGATANGVTIDQLACDGQSSQQWTFRNTGGGLFQIVAGNSGKCIDVPNGSSADGTILQQQDCAVESKQLWTLQEEPDGYHRIVSAVSGKCLDVAGMQTDDGRAVQQWSCLNQDNQRWKLGTNTPPTEPNWTYCAGEWEQCTFSGTRQVRFGVDGQWVTRTATDSIACNIDVFGDPYPGANKHCEFASSTTTPNPPTNGTPGPYMQDASLYQLTFSDEFNGSALDRTKWRDRYAYDTYPDGTLNNYAVEGGFLKIWPERLPDGTFNRRTIVTELDDSNHTGFYQTYGYFEARAKFPVGSNVWPGFWLLNNDVDTPAGPCGKEYRPELDIYELFPQYDKVAMTTWEFGNAAQCSTPTADSAVAIPTGFNTYGLKWEPNKMTYYFNGQPVAEHNVNMSTRMYVLLQLWFQQNMPGNDTVTGPGNSHEIDYVRVWQFK